MELVPFDPQWAATVSGWVSTDDEARAWCSADQAPVPPETIARWSADPDVRAFAALLGTEPVAYGELWLDDDEGEVELARLVVAPAQRGRGVGRELVRQLTARAREHHPRVSMRVRPDNEAALRCYLGAGFVHAAPAAQAQWNQGQPVAYVWLLAAG